MSQIWSEADKAKMREAASDHMMETGYRYVYSKTLDDFGGLVETWTKAALPFECGLQMHAGSERMTYKLTVTTYDATLRVPSGTELDVKDRVEITAHRDDEFSMMFEVVTPLQVGVSGYLVGLNKVEV